MGDFVSEKKKVGIVTLHGYFNYGNRLQNYAVEQVLKSLGCEVETIRNESIPKNNSNVIKKVLRLLINNPKQFFVKIFKKINSNNKDKKVEEFNTRKKERFINFSKEFLNESDFFISPNNIPENFEADYDYFITGSDQVWNPTIGSSSPLHFLFFATQEKRIAFSPSFAISEIPVEYRDNFRKWINEMNYLSVRENEGAEIINRLAGRNAPVLVDPTMVLTKEDWKSIADEFPSKPEKNYLFTYILGNLSNEKEKSIKEIAKDNNLEIVNLADQNKLDYYTSGPREFLDFIKSASLVLTDSFHASIFSIIFKTPFIVFDRMDNNLPMNSRINTLLKKFDLMSRYNLSLNSNNNEIFSMNFDKVENILTKEREKVMSYLKEALDINED